MLEIVELTKLPEDVSASIYSKFRTLKVPPHLTKLVDFLKNPLPCKFPISRTTKAALSTINLPDNFDKLH